MQKTLAKFHALDFDRIQNSSLFLPNCMKEMTRQNNIKLNLAADFQENLNYIHIIWAETEE